MSENNVTPTPLSLVKGHRRQVSRNNETAFFRSLQSVRTAPTLKYSTETGHETPVTSNLHQNGTGEAE